MNGFTIERWEAVRVEVVEDADLRRRVVLLSDEGKRLWITRCRARVEAGEPIDGLGWRALVDVRLARQGTPDGDVPEVI